MITLIKILRLVVVLPIALILIILLPIWELFRWVGFDGRNTWAECARVIINRIANFIWP